MTDDLSYWFRYGKYYGERKMPVRVYAGVRDEPIRPSHLSRDAAFRPMGHSERVRWMVYMLGRISWKKLW